MKRLLKISKYKPSILQGKFEFKAGAERVSLSLEHPRERFLLHLLSICLVGLVCLYLYFITASVLNVMARKEAMGQINDIQGAIGKAEQQYFALSQGVTPEEGASLGLVPISNTQYVYRPGAVGAVTIARNAI
jgi:hypothetical protein